MKMIAEYLEHSIHFQRMAEESDDDPLLKEQLHKQALAYRKLALERAKRLGVQIEPHFKLVDET